MCNNHALEIWGYTSEDLLGQPLARLMPELEAYFHYRNLDVSTLKELARRWYPDVAAGFYKESKHLALDDIRDSIDELRYYRARLFRP